MASSKRGGKGPAKVGPDSIHDLEAQQWILDHGAEAAELKAGAIAVIDALGFKGIWSRHPVHLVIEKIGQTKKHLLRKQDENVVHYASHLSVAAFSDTIVLSAFPLAEADLTEALLRVVDSTCDIVTMAAIGSPGLVYRGCVTVGDLYVAGDVFLGPAIDAAAANFERADAAVVWLTPEASALVPKNRFEVFDWDVPLKGLGALQTKVMNPLAAHARAMAFHGNVYSTVAYSFTNQIAKFLAPFGDAPSDLGVAMKKQRTAELLGVAHGHSRHWLEAREAEQRAAGNYHETDEDE